MKKASLKVISFGSERSIKLFSKSECVRAHNCSIGGMKIEEIAAAFCTSVSEAVGMIDAGSELIELEA